MTTKTAIKARSRTRKFARTGDQASPAQEAAEAVAIEPQAPQEQIAAKPPARKARTKPPVGAAEQTDTADDQRALAANGQQLRDSDQEATAATGGTQPATEPAPEAAPKTKIDLILGMLRRDGGATLDEMVAATGWLPHTTRAALTGLKKKGHALSSEKIDDVRRYGVTGAPA